MEFQDFTSAVKVKIQDAAKVLSDADVHTITVDVLSELSRDLPAIEISDIVGDGGFDYSLPALWQEDFSLIKAVEFPVGERIPNILESGDWMLYDDGTENKLRFLVDTPSSSENIRIKYTIGYTKITAVNIPVNNQDAFSTLAASSCCSAIARKLGFTVDPTIDVDVID